MTIARGIARAFSDKVDLVMAGTGTPLRSRSGDPVVPAIHGLAAHTDVDARQRRQVYAVCASLTALPGMT